MADYYGKGRTNVFKVKDIDALTTALAGADFIVDTRPDRGADAVFIRVSDDDASGSWGQLVYTDDDAEPTQLSVPDMIAEHLQHDQVAVFVHVGSEKLRYLSAYSIAVHADGRQVRVDIDDIYQRAASEFGVTIGEIDWAMY
ncbi:hypothetical protein [Mycolicibacterium palauense]|uniref:hypothetical protein n=1 Tax=Mycolicibacterium palauense TaxID=2034511 RepID=UPI000BFF15A1|nr:hypothetical protein [Mycolicibacterium palauense]